MATKNTSKTPKHVTVLATYKWKKLDRICYLLKSSSSDEQYTCCFDRGRASCTCPATRECYHIKQLASRAFDWRVSAGHVHVPAEPEPVEAEHTEQQAAVVETVKAEVAKAIESHKRNESQAEAGRQLIREANAEHRAATARTIGKLVSAGIIPGVLMPPPNVPVFGQMSAPAPLNVSRSVLMR